MINIIRNLNLGNYYLLYKDPNQLALLTGVALILCLIGASVPFYVEIMGISFARLVVFPILIVLIFLLIYSRTTLLFLILIFRSAGDMVFETTKFNLGGINIGVGGLINAFVILIALLLIVERPGVLSKKMITPWAAFLLIALYGVITAPVKVDAIRFYLSLLSYFTVFVSAFYFVRAAPDFKFCIRLVLWSSILPALYALVDIALNGEAGGIEGFRLKSTFGHPNAFAFYLALVISLTLYMVKSEPHKMLGRNRLLLTLYMVFLLVLLILTKTRSAWIVCFAIFTLYAFFFERRYLIYLLLLPFCALLIPGINERISDLGGGNEVVQYARLNSFAWRVYLWQSALNWAQPENYLLGHGLHSFKYYSPTFFPLAGRINWEAHSVYVQWLFELGVIGSLAYLWLFGRLLWLLKPMFKIDKLGAFIVITTMTNYLIVSFSDNMIDILAFNWYFWVVVGAACSVVLGNSRIQSAVPGQPDMK